MDLKLLRDYARLIAQMGGHVVKDDIVWINAQLDQPEFVNMVVEECYKAGAKRVEVNWSYDPLVKTSYKYETASSLGKLTNYALTKWKYALKKLPVTIYLISDDPDGLKGVSQSKMAKVRALRYKQIKPYRQAMESKYKWCIAAVPGKAWANKMFPKLSDEEAIEKLWEAILATSRVDGNDPVVNWENHNKFLHNQCRKLESMRLVKLIYSSSNGTDFEVGLNPDVRWGGGEEVAPGKGPFNPNIPSEEAFTTPIAGKAEGTVVASKPLSYNGELIEDFSITFKDGKAVSCKAKKNQKLLETMISMDEGAAKLGECALVPFDSPINNTGLLFYNTLFDENAACHLALGMGFRELLPNSENMSTEEVQSHGINDSMIHVDFMIGTKDLSIVGVDEKGKKTQIFKDGNWAL